MLRHDCQLVIAWRLQLALHHRRRHPECGRSLLHFETTPRFLCTGSGNVIASSAVVLAPPIRPSLPRGSPAKSNGSQRLPPPDCSGAGVRAPQARLMGPCCAALHSPDCQLLARRGGSVLPHGGAQQRRCQALPQLAPELHVHSCRPANRGHTGSRLHSRPRVRLRGMIWMRVAHCDVCH